MFVAVVIAAAVSAASPVRISGVYFDGYLKGTPEPDSAIRLTNTDLEHPAPLGGFVLTERFTPKKKTAALTTTKSNESNGRGRERDRNDDNPEGVRFPQGAAIPPGGELWVAATAWGFARVWGYPPGYEASSTSPEVPDLEGPGVFLKMPGNRGSVALVDDGGAIIDFVPYENTKVPELAADDFKNLPWKGAPVRLFNASLYGWTGQVLARDRDEVGHLVDDTNSAADWDSGSTKKRLGDDSTHRVERAGQSLFVSHPLTGRAKLLATSAPDNNFKELIAAFDAAKRSIHVRIYELTNPKIIEGLVRAKLRGVDVVIYLEGAPVGGIADQERWLLDRAHKAGIPCYFLGSTPKNPIKPRYRFDHSKYVIIDDEKVIIGSENYGRSGVPVINSWGNRGWMVHITKPELVAQLKAVWDTDLRLDKGVPIVGDIVDIDASATDAYGMPYRDPSFSPDESIHRGRYDAPAEPVLVDDDMKLELVLSPDTSLNEHSAIMGVIERADKTLFVEQNSIRRRWGKKDDDNDTEGDVPNLPLQAVIAAARRGVSVRVLLDSTWYNVQGDEDRDNDDTAIFLNDLAAQEGLDLVAKVINLEATALEKIHTKGVIADPDDKDGEVFIGSINWTENSFKGNREVGVVVGHPKVAGYYAKLFRRDWARSRIYQAPVVVDKGTAHERPDAKSPVLWRIGRKDTLSVVGEHTTKGARWLEVRLPPTPKRPDATAFVPINSAGTPLASPGEALHVIGKTAVVEGVVVVTNVSDKRVQLRFADAKKPPFVAVIFDSALSKWEALKEPLDPRSAYQGRLVRVSGAVKSYQSPEIVVDGPDQITILK
jgi:phosphatidylserine/phosphatidylglycerophosphate/cardiolipin synthase-like enzyme